MPLATTNTNLREIRQCTIQVPNADPIILDNLPDITDSKGASYNDETIIGRSTPIKTYKSSDNRTISMQLHFYITEPGDEVENLEKLRTLESAVYPQEGQSGVPFVPPPVCKIKCGQLLSSGSPLNAVLTSYSVKFPTDVAWNSNTFCPYKMDVDTVWHVVYTSVELPGQNRIIRDGR